MTKRLKKKAEKRKRALIHEILDMVLDINGTGARKQSETGNLPTAFFDFLGHVAGLDVRLYRDGYYVGSNAEWVLQDVCTDSTVALKQAICTLKCDTLAAETARESM